jgi:putative molybdopterin biosynthesis protein
MKNLFEHKFLDTLPLDEASRILFEYFDSIKIYPLSEENIKVIDSLNRITAKPIYAKYSSPSYHCSAMDGYAVRFTDTLTASDRYPCLLKIGVDAIYVNTGDPLPEGFNSIIMFEDVNVIRKQKTEDRRQITEEYIEIYQPVTPYQNVRIAGEDIISTELIIPENHKIRAIDIGAMLASGQIYVPVRKKPKVTIIPTGNELIEPEETSYRLPKPSEIIEYNSAMLLNLIKELGGDVVRYAIVKDDLDELKRAIRGSLETSDVILVNAGSGRGSKDYTLSAIKELGEVVFSGLSIKPGKPLIAGIIKSKPIFGIPGYPVSAYITFDLFIKPLLLKMLGIKKEEKVIKASLSRQIVSSLGVDEFIRVKIGNVKNKYIVTPIGRGAGLLMTLVRADGILRIPADIEAISSGTDVLVTLLRDEEDIKNTIVCIGSHDNTLDILSNWIKKRFPHYCLSSAHVGSMGGLMAIKKGEAHIAGTHLLDEKSGEYNITYIKKVLPEKEVILINLVYRLQGLLVKKGNPKKIKGFEDLLREDVYFINRQYGSGTRLLLDKHLKELNVNPFMIKGYEKEEYTHMAVASAVLTGQADTGLAVYSSAKALGLDFIPVAEERYDLVIPKEFLTDKKIEALLDILREDKEFRTEVESLGGYDTRDMGKVIYES